jgi:hypothetical protein
MMMKQQDYWSKYLSEYQFDGIIGLSQGAAMCAVLIAMIQHPERLNDFKFGLKQPIKFGIMCSGQTFFLERKRG